MARSQTNSTNRRSAKKIKSTISGIITIIVAVIVVVTIVLDWYDDRFSTSPTEHSTAAEYRELLNGLDQKGRAPKTAYDREKFGSAWTDDVTVEFGKNGCDTRNDILQRDLVNYEFRESDKQCLIGTGTLYDPFSGETIAFARGERSSEVQIDHIVPLKDAWVKGAWRWSDQKRKDFANDPDNLLAVKGSLNQQKGASDAATWLPPNDAFRCDYAKKIITIKDRYKVSVTKAEATALHEQLDTCPA
ncbi:HNH endonuclease family protein [Corynebacterium crudilactis]|uniref:GmrSD restriction endonucleases C-terminal domain-containing protein n=1 Tax=Corynebacterium crudilactis TaxID=1652495 RepID=A0A172QT07_9CORY|nr:HNH endonuclease family protein [Corynebacterium crudilactis]ANE03822.1 hypothetical protein ccrud_06080 [Corynebacterium crudilactis]